MLLVAATLAGAALLDRLLADPASQQAVVSQLEPGYPGQRRVRWRATQIGEAEQPGGEIAVRVLPRVRRLQSYARHAKLADPVRGRHVDLPLEQHVVRRGGMRKQREDRGRAHPQRPGQ